MGLEDEKQPSFGLVFPVPLAELRLCIFVDNEDDQNWTYLYYVPNQLKNDGVLCVMNQLANYSKRVHVNGKTTLRKRFSEVRTIIMMRNPTFICLYEGGMNFG